MQLSCKILSSFIAILICTAFMIACSENEEVKDDVLDVVGTWKGTYSNGTISYFVFYPNGTGVTYTIDQETKRIINDGEHDFTWNISNSTLVLTFKDGSSDRLSLQGSVFASNSISISWYSNSVNITYPYANYIATGESFGHEYVDLGLPSRTLWATYNIGASFPEDKGSYYGWGKICVGEKYDWEDYGNGYFNEDDVKKHAGKATFKWIVDTLIVDGNKCIGSKLCKITYKDQEKWPLKEGQNIVKEIETISLKTYCTYDGYAGAVQTSEDKTKRPPELFDNKTSLDDCDDIVHLVWKGNWTIPTTAQFEELLDPRYCTCVWTKLERVAGYKITSITNGNAIFFPAVGYKQGSITKEAGGSGTYWTKNLCPSFYDSAEYFYFSTSDNVGIIHKGGRYLGRTIRPVCVLED